MSKRVYDVETYQEYARELLGEFDTYYASAKALGDKNFRSGIGQLLKQDRLPSARLSEALEVWATIKPVIIQALPGSNIFGDVGLIDFGQVVDVLILSLGEIDDSLLVKCKACGTLTFKRAGNQRYCRQHSWATPQGRRWHRQQKKREDVP